MQKQTKTKIILYDSYMQAVKNSIGSNLFRNLYAKIDGRKKDILENGNLSCAIFVSSILYLHKLISDLHATVTGTVNDLEKSGWIKITKPKIGAVLVWETKKFEKGQHKHVGFYIGNNKAISHEYEKRQPILHHWTFGAKDGQPIRKVERILWNNKLLQP
ncbi:MAG: C40 family peptidase [Candidatus Yanofskybacteria bacterium]|nr:C40 family peptidase [Candidatus Yanofskybacteria bacterium]